MRGRRLRLRSVVIAVVVAIVALSPLAPVVAQQELHEPGVQLADMDLSVDPGFDFYRYANGGWLDRTELPPEMSGTEPLSILADETRYQLVGMLWERSDRGDARPGSDEWKAIRLFEQGLDFETRDAQGIDPIRPILAEIDAIDDPGELHSFLQVSVFQYVIGLFGVVPLPDLEDSSRTVAYLGTSWRGLPTRDHYLQDDDAMVAIRDAYVASSADLLTLIGRDEDDARIAAQAAFAFETSLVEPTLSDEEARDLSVFYNLFTREELAATYPLMDWAGYLDALGLSDVSRVVVAQPRYLAALDEIVREAPVSVIKDFLTLELLWSASDYLSGSFKSTAFAFTGTALSGVDVQGPPVATVVDTVNAYLPDALGKLYVEEYFSPEAKAQSTELIREVVAASRGRLQRNPWMTEATKARAIEKLDALTIQVGYPDQWEDYGEVAISDSYFGSILSASNASYRASLAEIGSPVDRDAWHTSPQTVNAYYDVMNNAIVLPAAILQPPFFDPRGDPASNFGAIGFVIGHEITHAFDRNGAQFDSQGDLEDWWIDEDDQRFQALNDAVAAQYSAIEILPDRFVDGQLTVTENVADMGGIQVAYDALQAHLAKHGRPALDELALTQEQRFFIAAATVWRAEIREEEQMYLLSFDPHAPSSVRATQPMRNCDAFYAAFATGPGDPMYLPPSERIVIW
jgi:predicted metalloendopeptidase